MWPYVRMTCMHMHTQGALNRCRSSKVSFKVVGTSSVRRRRTTQQSGLSTRTSARTSMTGGMVSEHEELADKLNSVLNVSVVDVEIHRQDQDTYQVSEAALLVHTTDACTRCTWNHPATLQQEYCMCSLRQRIVALPQQHVSYVCVCVCVCRAWCAHAGCCGEWPIRGRSR